ncbi:MAG: lipopolysaccharide kinase InaA family protein [Longimicrobiales bacterium]
MIGAVCVTLPAGYTAFRASGSLFVCRTELSAELYGVAAETGSLYRWAAAHPQRETVQGRGTAYIVPFGGGRVVVRHYRRGGRLAAVLGDRYLRAAMPRPVRELRTSRAAAERGIPVADVLAVAVYQPVSLLYRGDAVTSYVSGASDLAARVFGDAATPASAAAAAEVAGHTVRRAHDRGLEHRDLNLKNVLIAERAGALSGVIIDLDRARVVDTLSDAARRAMLARFERSWRKWARRTGRAAADALAAFRSGYEAAS